MDFFKKKEGKIMGEYPHNEFKLVVSSYETKKGCWNYTQGLVYKEGIDKPLFDVKRNYASFPYLWIDHPNGHQYLVCGADYQGQTVLELDTGKRRDFLPEAAKKGHGFCWVDYRFDSESKILTVAGCFWACPYEYRFFDFSDPMKGWPWLETEESIDDNGPEWPVFEPEGVIKAFQIQTEDEEGEEINPPVLRATKTFKREGLKLILIKEDVSEEEQKLRLEREEGWKKYNEEIKRFKETDPLYLLHVKLAKDPALSPEDHCGYGFTYENWCPHFKISERRFCRRIVNKGKITVDLEWGMYTGPIKVVMYKKGKKMEDKWFEHSEEGMSQAFKIIKEEI